MIKQVIFICGLGGDAGMTYVPMLRDFCEKKGWEFFAPSMPSFEEGITYQKYSDSFENLINTKPIDFNHLLIICQSAGTNFIVKYMGLHSNISKLGGYISVSGFSNPPDQKLYTETLNRLMVLNTFYPTKTEYKNFKSLPFKKCSIFGGKDCFFTVKNLKAYANQIGAKKYFDKNLVHCTISENVTTHELLHFVIEQNFCKNN